MKACCYKGSKQHELSLQLAFLLQREIAFFQQAKSPMLVKVVCLFVCLRVFSPNALILKESPKMHGFGVFPTNLYKDKRTIYSFACPNKSKSSCYTINHVMLNVNKFSCGRRAVLGRPNFKLQFSLAYSMKFKRFIK